MLALEQENSEREREKKKTHTVCTWQYCLFMLLKTHGRKFPTESEDKLHVYKHVVTLFISVTREEVHRARLGPR